MRESVIVLKLRVARQRQRARDGRCERAKPYGILRRGGSVTELLKSAPRGRTVFPAHRRYAHCGRHKASPRYEVACLGVEQDSPPRRCGNGLPQPLILCDFAAAFGFDVPTLRHRPQTSFARFAAIFVLGRPRRSLWAAAIGHFTAALVSTG
jgi:hypothetical protein